LKARRSRAFKNLFFLEERGNAKRCLSFLYFMLSSGRNPKVKPDLSFASNFFAGLCQAFQVAAANHQIAPCLLIQALMIECFAIAAYNNYIPVADNFAREVQNQ
jgi:Long-chain fatty aldehyde decarbonylase